MLYKNVVDNPKIKIAKNDTNKCVVSINDIANRPHYYRSKLLLCPRCNEELQIADMSGRFFLKHSRFGGEKHYVCPLYTAGYNLDTIHYIKAEFISKQEIELNYSLIIENEQAKVFITIPTITEKTCRKFKEYKGRVVVSCENENYRISCNDLSVNLSSYIELINKKKVTSFRFEYENEVNRYVTNWNYDDALFIYKQEGIKYYLNKITYEVGPDREFAYLSKNAEETIDGADIKIIKKVLIDGVERYLKTIIFHDNTDEVDEFLLAHDCSYSTKEVLRYHKYISCLKSHNKTVYDFKSYEKETIVEQPKKDFYPYIGVCVSHSIRGEGYVTDIYSSEALKVRFGKDEVIIKKDSLNFHDEMYNFMRLLLYLKTIIYKGEKHKAIDYHDGRVLLDNNETIEYFNKEISILNTSDKIINNEEKENKKEDKKEKDYAIGEVVMIEGRRCVLKNIKNNTAEFETSTGKIYFIKLIDGSVKKGLKEKFKKH